MERVYLLLRNNQQTGPFTIGELLQQQLRSSDMIWIEGKSTAWTYLSELELIPHLQEIEMPKQNHIRINEKDEIERKAEELRQRVLASAPKTYFPKHVTEIETYSSPYKMPEEQIQFVDYRKEKRVKRNAVLGEFLLTCVVIGLFLLGIYKGKSFLAVKKDVQNSVATQLDSGDQHTAQRAKPNSQTIAVSPDTTINHKDSLLAVPKLDQKATVGRKRVIDSSISIKPSNAFVLNPLQKKEDSQSNSQTPAENSVRKEIVTKREIVPVIQGGITNSDPVREEKKGFLKGLFRKKKATNSDTTGSKSL